MDNEAAAAVPSEDDGGMGGGGGAPVGRVDLAGETFCCAVETSPPWLRPSLEWIVDEAPAMAVEVD